MPWRFSTINRPYADIPILTADASVIPDWKPVILGYMELPLLHAALIRDLPQPTAPALPLCPPRCGTCDLCCHFNLRRDPQLVRLLSDSCLSSPPARRRRVFPDA